MAVPRNFHPVAAASSRRSAPAMPQSPGCFVLRITSSFLMGGALVWRIFRVGSVLYCKPRRLSNGSMPGSLPRNRLYNDHRLFGTAAREDVVAKRLGHLLVEDISRFLEGFKRVGIQDFRPQVRVVTGRIATRKDVLEVRTSITRDDLRDQADFVEAGFFELLARQSQDCGSVIVCQSMSRNDAARYSVVANPWLKKRALRIFSINSSGIGCSVS